MLKIEVGCWYETRSGKQVEIIANNGTDIWEFDGRVDGYTEQYRADGRYYGSDRDCPADLVKEVPNPKTPDHA
jgi:outer membrane protein assembly factor BamB